MGSHVTDNYCYNAEFVKLLYYIIYIKLYKMSSWWCLGRWLCPNCK